jgi:L-cysteate sulfo-lyase
LNLFETPFQTPLQPMLNLQSYLNGPRLMVKRDDLTPFGGGKYRKVFVLVEEASKCGATVLLTEGSIESRHARTTAILARQKGIQCVLVLSPESDPDSKESTLLECDEGARIILTRDWRDRKEILKRESEALANKGEIPIIIQFSCSTPLTALAYLYAFAELKQQTEALDTVLDSVVFSSASGGIQAGLELGKRYYQMKETILLGVSPGLSTIETKKQIIDLATSAAELFGLDVKLRADDICVSDEYEGGGYLQPTLASKTAMDLALKLEGLTLDPTYTAKAFAALIDQVEKQRFPLDSTVVFLHTAG